MTLSRREQVQEMLAEISDAEAGISVAQEALREAKNAKLTAEDRLMHYLTESGVLPPGMGTDVVVGLLKAVVP